MHKPHIALEELRSQVEGCHRCPLAEGRTQTVFGAGNPNARVLIIGEAPGKNEDLQGEPFVGAAGKYLNELLGYAGLARDDVFIANVLKCRPPDNRNPQPSEIEVCTPFLREQTRTIDPDIIVTLGNFATKFVLKTDRGITGLHGKLYQAGKFKVFPIFHPAAAIYDRGKRDALETDFRTLGEMLKEFAHESDMPTIETSESSLS
ncbi:MAG: uracil-DNA glycosylase [Raoultibacter sp.]